MKYFKHLYLILLSSIAIHSSLLVNAQNIPVNFEEAYGLDPILYNGRIYSYFLPPGTGGTQFLEGTDFVKGSALIRGILYEDLALNYDVYNQQLILEYYPEDRVKKQIVISDAWLEEFNLGNLHFELLAISDSNSRIYQVVENDTYRILYLWRKDLPLDNKHGATNHVFSNPLRESFLFVNNQLSKYGNNKSFVALFEPDDQAKLKKYLRQKRVKLKKASDESIMDLLDFCNALSLR